MTRRRRLLLIAAAALLAVVAAGVVALPRIARAVVVWRLAAMTGRPVTLAALELHLVGGRLALHDLRIADRDGGALAALERLEVRFRPRELLRGHLHVTGATLEAPALRVVRTGPRAFNVSDLVGRPSTAGGGSTGLGLTVDHFALRGGAVTLEDRTLAPARTWRVERLALEVHGVSTRAGAKPGTVTLSAVAAGSPVSLWAGGVRLAPLAFSATVNARSVDASLAALYLPPGSPLSPARGTLDASATVERTAEALRVSLDAVFSGVELLRPRQAVPYLTAPAVRITVEDLILGRGAIALGRLAVDGGRLELEDTRLAPVRRWRADGIAFEVRNVSSARDAPAGVATARAVVAGSPLTAWAGDLRLAPLELNAAVVIRNVDFALFRLYVPRDLPVQPERGVVNATLRLARDARRGTRLALDATLSDVEVRRPAHFVTAPALRVTAEEIALGDGVARVGHAAVTGARLTIEDRKIDRAWPVQDLAVEARDLSSRRQDVQGVVSARATVAGAAVSAWVTRVRLDPLELNATAILRNLDLALVQLYLPPGVPLELQRGVVNASVQVAHDEATGTRLTGDVTLTGATAHGRGALDRLAVAAPALRVAIADVRWREHVLDVGRAELTASGVLADARTPGERLDVEQLRLATEALGWPLRGPARLDATVRLRDGGEASVRGTALLTAPPPMIAWTSELAVELKSLDVGRLAAHVPLARGLGGRVSARLDASLAYGASLVAHVRGDLGASRLALVDDGRRLLRLRQLDATGLDVLWPERVAVARLRLERPRAHVEIDRQGAIPLLARFARPAVAVPDAAPAPGAPDATSVQAAPAPRRPAIAAGEVVVDRGRVTLVDARPGTPARIEVPRIDLTLRDAAWPATTTPARVKLDLALPAGGTAAVEGTLRGEGAEVDLRLTLADAALGALQPFLPFRAGVRARLDTTLAVKGPLLPRPRLSARGDAALKSLALLDGARPVLTVERIGATGIDLAWPERLTLEKVRVQRSWALIARDRQGNFLLRDLLGRPPRAAGEAPPPAPPAPSPAAAPFQLTMVEGVFEEGSVTIDDAVTTPPAHLDVAGTRLEVHDFAWPARGPVRVALTSPAPGGGKVDVGGTLTLDPGRLEARAVLDQVEVAPAQPYLPIDGRVAGRVSGDLAVTLAFEPLAVQVTGQARLQRFTLSDGDRPLVSAGRAEASGVDIDWPRRVALERFLLRFPKLLIERNVKGEVTLPRLVTPHWPAKPRVGSGAAEAAPAGADGTAPGAPRPLVQIGTVRLERGTGRFVDETLSPPFAEQLSRVELTVTGLTTAPGGRARITGTGALGGGGSVKLEGDAATDAQHVDLAVEVSDYAIARANAYLERYTDWTATQGTLSATARYTLAGTTIDAEHDLVVRGLDVEHTGERDEVEKRLGLPLGFLVSLLKDARGEIHLSVPVSGDLAKREFDFQEATWGAVRALAIRLLALPFSKVGSLFFSEDSKVRGVALTPILFEAGTAMLTPPMREHLDRIAEFMKDAPAVGVRLVPIFVQGDLDALRRARTAAGQGEELPPEALRELGTQRLDVVREGLARRGGVDASRLTGQTPRRPLVEGGAAARVELDLRS